MLEILKTEIEQSTGRSMQCPCDFDWLSLNVKQRTGERISPSTLKRLWGYMKDGGRPRQFTLEVLARFLGYSNYETFLQNRKKSDSSLIFNNGSLSTETLKTGDWLIVRWQPDRKLVVCYCGQGRFRVMESENTKLSVGDTFMCHVFINHEPLYISQLIHDNNSLPVGYVAGKHNGITVEKVMIQYA